jgi:16S rRNA (cytidine1402-2'-O)-methyltransferase
MVATPIGNLADLSPRAAAALSEANIIACEDTRQTRKLLNHLGIKKPCISIREHNESTAGLPLLQSVLEEQLTLAYVSDAGTPGVSDPGAKLAEMAHHLGIAVYAVSGPSALASAISVTGFGQAHSYFIGFLPRKPQEIRAAIVKALRVAPIQLIFFESPKRIQPTIKVLAATLPSNTRICICREMTKLFESNRVLFLEDAQESLLKEPLLGEFAVVIDLVPLQADYMSAIQNQAFSAPETSAPSLPELGFLAVTSRGAEQTLRDAARSLALKHPNHQARDIYQAALNSNRREVAQNDSAHQPTSNQTSETGQ